MSSIAGQDVTGQDIGWKIGGYVGTTLGSFGLGCAIGAIAGVGMPGIVIAGAVSTTTALAKMLFNDTVDYFADKGDWKFSSRLVSKALFGSLMVVAAAASLYALGILATPGLVFMLTTGIGYALLGIGLFFVMRHLDWDSLVKEESDRGAKLRAVLKYI